MAFKPFSVVPCVIVFLGNLESREGVVEELCGLEARGEIGY